MIYTVTINPALDYRIYTEQIRHGEINWAEREELHAGGKGINVSTVLHSFGVATTALGFVGGQTGEMLCRFLDQEKIVNDFLRVRGMTRINVKVREKNAETDINGAGPEVSQKDLDRLIEKLEQIPETSVVVLAGSVPLSLPQDSYSYILKSLQKKNLRIVADTAGRLLKDILMYRPWLVKPNREELGELFGTKIEDCSQVYEWAEELLRLGARNVIVSLGEDGAVFMSENGTKERAASYYGRVKDTVGSGDALLAAFLAAKENGGSDRQALEVGVAAGCATAFRSGLATAAETRLLMDNGILKKI